MMNEQVRSFIPHLKPGGMYLFQHTRKGPFVARFRGTAPMKEGDPQDEIWIDVDIYTEDGSGQERLANTFMRDELGRKMRPPFESRRIRPSLLLSITSPSTETQATMARQFNEAREKAIKRAEETDTEPQFPALSLPTEQALRKIGGEEESEDKKPGIFKRLFGGK